MLHVSVYLKIKILDLKVEIFFFKQKQIQTRHDLIRKNKKKTLMERNIYNKREKKSNLVFLRYSVRS